MSHRSSHGPFIRIGIRRVLRMDVDPSGWLNATGGDSSHEKPDDPLDVTEW